MENMEKFFIIKILDTVLDFFIAFIECPIGITFAILFITFSLLVFARSLIVMR